MKRMLSCMALGTMALSGCMVEPTAVSEERVDEGREAILGGTLASIASFPWQVSLQWRSAPTATYQHWCGGAILNQSWIVTATHCINDTRNDMITDQPSRFRVVAGVARLSSVTSSRQERTVAEIVPYPGYDAYTKDLALVRLSSPLSLGTTSTSTVKRIDMVTPAEAETVTAPGVRGKVTGWGSISSDIEDGVDDLRVVEIPILSNDEGKRRIPSSIIAPQNLVAGSTGKGSCWDDSGGPLVVRRGTSTVLAGIVNWGLDCGDVYPGVYARVSSFRSWIQERIALSFTPLLTETGRSASTGDSVTRAITVPAGTKTLNVRLSGATGNADLLVKRGPAGTGTVVCTGNHTNSDEACSIDSPTAGTWTVVARATRAFSGLSMNATVLR